MIRTFIALELPGEVKARLADIVSGLKPKAQGVKWVLPDGLHVTLKFLGGIDEGLVPGISRALDSVAAAHPVLRASLSRLGAFPDPRKPRVIWAGLEGDTRFMADIAREVDRECASFGMEPEKRPFQAHITIGRLKVPSMIDLSREVRDSVFSIEHIVLYKSELTPSGARYSVLHRSVLGQTKGE